MKRKAIVVKYEFKTRLIIDEKDENIRAIDVLAMPKVIREYKDETLENYLSWKDGEEKPSSRSFKLIKEFPLSPKAGTVVTFKEDKDFNDGIYNVGAMPNLILEDCTGYPEFWREV